MCISAAENAPLDLDGPGAVRVVLERQAEPSPGQIASALAPANLGQAITSDDAMVLDTDGHFGRTSRAQLAAAFQKLRSDLNAGRAQRFAIFFHGGLVTVDNGIGTASQLIAPYKAAETYPFFPVWDTGWADVLAQHWASILGGTLFQTIFGHVHNSVALSAPQTNVHALLALRQAGVGEIPAAPERIKGALSSDEQDALAAAVDNDLVVRSTIATLQAKSVVQHRELLEKQTPERDAEYFYLDSSVVRELIPAAKAARQPLPEEESRSLAPITFGVLAVRVALRIIERYRTKRDHPGLCTFTEEILRAFFVGPFGTALWAQMKASIEAGLSKDDPNAGARALVDEMVSLLRERPSLQLTLIGHSAGAIYAARLLEELDLALPDVSWTTDMVFIAAALRFNRFEETLKVSGSRIRGFRSFQLAEEFESSDSVLSDIGLNALQTFYPSSLLYLISGLLEDDPEPALGDTPLVGMVRYQGQIYRDDSSIAALLTFEGKQAIGTVLSSSSGIGPPGAQSQAQHHGPFPTDPDTVASVAYVLTNGLESPVGSAAASSSASRSARSVWLDKTWPRKLSQTNRGVATGAVPSTLQWGVDTSLPATAQALAVASARVQKPSFWGRYLTGYPIEDGEVDFLHSEGIAVLPIYQATTAHSGLLSGSTSGQCGAADAARAVSLAASYGIPSDVGIAIYCDIEPEYEVSQYWLQSWINGLAGNGFLAGIYCGSNQHGIVSGMRKVSGIDPSRIIVWSCMPHDTTKNTLSTVPTGFGAPGLAMSDGYVDLDLWQYCLDFGAFDFNIASARALSAMWR